MNLKGIIYYILITTVICSCCSISTASYHDYEVECLGKTMDGKQTLQVWASGKNRSDAIEQAMKRAVYEVTFTGISAGSGECNAYPIIDEANSRKKQEDYFDMFFSDGGAYKNFVSTDGQKKNTQKKLKGKGREMYGIIVVVDRSALRKHFEKDNIIVK